MAKMSKKVWHPGHGQPRLRKTGAFTPRPGANVHSWGRGGVGAECMPVLAKAGGASGRSPWLGTQTVAQPCGATGRPYKQCLPIAVISAAVKMVGRFGPSACYSSCILLAHFERRAIRAV